MEQDYVGRSGDVGGYRVEIGDDEVRVLKEGVEVVRRRVEPHAGRSLADFVATAGRARLAWGRLPEGDEVIVISDAAGGDGLSYAIGITNPELSGWTQSRPWD